MKRSLRPAALIAMATVIIGILENVFFGADHGGAKHAISVGFFLLTLVGAATLLVIGVLALARRVLESRTS